MEVMLDTVTNWIDFLTTLDPEQRIRFVVEDNVVYPLRADTSDEDTTVLYFD